MTNVKEYSVLICFTGNLYLYVKANSEEEAREKAQAHDWSNQELNISSSSINHVRQLPTYTYTEEED